MLGTYKEQIALEESRKEEAIATFIRKNTGDEVAVTMTKHGDTLVRLGFEPFKQKLDEYFEADLRSHSLKTRQFLQLMSEDTGVIAYVTLSAIINRLSGKSVSITSLAKAIFKRLIELNFFDNLKKEDPKLHAYLGKEYRDAGAARKRQLIKKHTKNMSYDSLEDTKATEIIRLGSTLIHILIQSGANIIKLKMERRSNKYPIRVAVLTEEAMQVMIDVFHRNLQFNISPSYLPMVYPPKKWSKREGGGYYTTNIPMFLSKKKITRKFLKKQDVSSLYPVINKAQDVAWRVNKRVVDVVEDIFRGNMLDSANPAKLPKLYGGLPTAELYKAEDLVTREQYPDWKAYTTAKDSLQIELDGEDSRRLALLLALDTAHQVIDYDAIYFPYQFDYRGRLYPNTRHLNPQAPKHIKAMLEFSKGEVLNEVGAKWLKIHIANTYGLDKEEFDKRIKWTDTHHSVLLAIANDPLEFVSEWAYTDSPFEFLAACFAYQDYILGKSVHLPIQLDATCSGIQFYSGLLLDKEGAESVNVIGDTRQDIYQKVADKVNHYLEIGDYPKVIEFRDSEKVERTATTEVEARSIKGKITRSLVKRNTMTVPYSVTMRGMSDQLWDEMDELDRKGKAFWSGDKWVVNKLMTYLNHKAIYEVVQGAKLGQDYFTSIARLIKEPAVWKTPIYSFPVLQPAVKEKVHKVKTVLGVLVTYLDTPVFSAGKQRQGIAPNIIHSLDAELLRYVVDNFEGDIGTVHDCFLVHPNQGEQVRDKYKEGYVLLMSMRPMEYIGRQIDLEHTIPVPCIGTLNLEDVYDSQYIIS